MSEFQIVLFRAIDRPLTDKQLEFMDRQSSRAEFTKWEFQVEYHYSSFRGDAWPMAAPTRTNKQLLDECELLRQKQEKSRRNRLRPKPNVKQKRLRSNVKQEWLRGAQIQRLG